MAGRTIRQLRADVFRGDGMDFGVRLNPECKLRRPYERELARA